MRKSFALIVLLVMVCTASGFSIAEETGTYKANLLTMAPEQMTTAEKWLQSDNNRAFFAAMSLLDATVLAKKDKSDKGQKLFNILLDAVTYLNSYSVEVSGKADDVNVLVWNEGKQSVLLTYHIKTEKIDYTVYAAKSKKPELVNPYSVVPKDCASIMQTILTQAGVSLN